MLFVFLSFWFPLSGAGRTIVFKEAENEEKIDCHSYFHRGSCHDSTRDYYDIDHSWDISAVVNVFVDHRGSTSVLGRNGTPLRRCLGHRPCCGFFTTGLLYFQ